MCRQISELFKCAHSRFTGVCRCEHSEAIARLCTRFAESPLYLPPDDSDTACFCEDCVERWDRETDMGGMSEMEMWCRKMKLLEREFGLESVEVSRELAEREELMNRYERKCAVEAVKRLWHEVEVSGREDVARAWWQWYGPWLQGLMVCAAENVLELRA